MDELNAARESALSDLREIFEPVRVRVYGRPVPQYEMASWRVQIEECRGWIADRRFPTPYLDAFLAECPKPDREEFVRTILRNGARFAEAMGRVNGVQTKYWDVILHAGTVEEIRNALTDAATAAAEL